MNSCLKVILPILAVSLSVIQSAHSVESIDDLLLRSNLPISEIELSTYRSHDFRYFTTMREDDLYFGAGMSSDLSNAFIQMGRNIFTQTEIHNLEENLDPGAEAEAMARTIQMSESIAMTVERVTGIPPQTFAEISQILMAQPFKLTAKNTAGKIEVTLDQVQAEVPLIPSPECIIQLENYPASCRQRRTATGSNFAEALLKSLNTLIAEL